MQKSQIKGNFPITYQIRLKIYLTKVSIKPSNTQPKTSQISVKQRGVKRKRGEYNVSNVPNHCHLIKQRKTKSSFIQPLQPM